jgi:hypothetical protein
VDLGIDWFICLDYLKISKHKDRNVKTRNVCRPGNENKYSAKGGIRSLNHSPHIAIFITKVEISNPSSISKLEPLQCPYLSYHYHFKVSSIKTEV